MNEAKKKVYKDLFGSLIIIFLIFSNGFVNAQQVLIVDHNFNAPTGPHIYSTIQAAVDAADAGDIIQIQPSPNNYGDVTIDKQLTLVGIGFNVVKDIPLESKMGDITFTNNADNTSNASGSTIMGLRLNDVLLGPLTGASFVLQNITFYNCIIAAFYNTFGYASIDGFTVEDCYVFSTLSSSRSIYIASPVTNAVIKNNLILYNIDFASSTPGSNTIANNLLYRHINITAEGTATNIINNVFAGASGTTYAFETLRDCVVSYNIFYGVTPSNVAGGGSTSTNFQRNVFTFNLVHSSGDDTWPPDGGGSGNSGSPNYVGSPLYADVQLLSSWSSGYDFTLDPSSPALLANIPDPGALTDIGFTGGSYPWSDSNFILQTSALPVIEILNTSTIINPGDNLPVHIKATSY